jgi:hypothetical protein
MTTSNSSVVTRVVSFLGSNGETHSIDCGVITAGEKKGEPKQRLSGAAVLKYIQDACDADMSPEDVVSLVLGTKSLGVAGDTERDEQYDGAFESVVNRLRGVALFSKPVGEVRSQALVYIATQEGWSLADMATKGKAVETAFSQWCFARSAESDSPFAKVVVERKGRQDITLKPAGK